MLAVFCDASVITGRRKGVSLGFAVVENGNIIEKANKAFYSDDVSSSEAEYLALIHSMRWVLRNAVPQRVYFFTDFIDIPKRLGKQETWNEHTWIIATLLDELNNKGFEPVIKWISRDFNIAHRPAKAGLEHIK